MLFARVAATGVGHLPTRMVATSRPDLLAEAISEIDANRAGIELRTVQLWFEDNEKGISPNNIRWLARVLGCNDPQAASAWQAELSAAQSRLMAKRRGRRRGNALNLAEPEDPWHEAAEIGLPEVDGALGRFGLARATEAFFSRGSILNLPAAVFAGAVALHSCPIFIHSQRHIPSRWGCEAGRIPLGPN